MIFVKRNFALGAIPGSTVAIYNHLAVKRLSLVATANKIAREKENNHGI
jgi:hypothetical protein